MFPKEFQKELRHCERGLLREFTYENVLKQLKALRNDTYIGLDGIPVRSIKLVQDSLSSPLTHIINTFIEINNFPSSRKCARIVPIKSDFRPIAILPVLSKIFERLVCSQVIGKRAEIIMISEQNTRG